MGSRVSRDMKEIVAKFNIATCRVRSKMASNGGVRIKIDPLPNLEAR
jgi:hypothetical protein